MLGFWANQAAPTVMYFNEIYVWQPSPLPGKGVTKHEPLYVRLSAQSTFDSRRVQVDMVMLGVGPHPLSKGTRNVSSETNRELLKEFSDGLPRIIQVKLSA